MLDKSREGWPASIAAIGLGLAAYPVSVDCGFMTCEDAVQRMLAKLRFFAKAPHGSESDATGHKGFYYHFLDMKSGQHASRSELSSVDTAFLLAGMLAAAAYYQHQSAEEAEIRRLADALYRKADWQWMQNEEASVSHGWTSEKGFLPYRWKGYDEALIIYLIGLGSPTHPLPQESFRTWSSTYEWKKVYGGEFLYPPNNLTCGFPPIGKMTLPAYFECWHSCRSGVQSICQTRRQPPASHAQKRNAKNERIIMLGKAKTLKGYKLNSLDGEIGKVKEFYFDDRHWTIRYLVADTGNWLTGRQVLISPYAMDAIISEKHRIAINLTKKQIGESPSLSSDKPVSRQFEQSYYGYYGYPMYWGGLYSWGTYPYIERDQEKWKASHQGEKAWDPHLRSTHGVNGYHVQALDGEIGHVEDFIIEDETWAIRYLVVGTRNWWPGKKVLVSPQWIERVSWSESKVFINLSREAIKQSPEYTQESMLTRDYEIGLHQHYERQGYWIDELAGKRQ